MSLPRNINPLNRAGVTSSAAELNILDGVTSTAAELDEVYLTVEIDDISTAGQSYIYCPVAGTVTSIGSVLNGAIATSDATLTAKINGTAITGGAITVATASSAAGDVDTATPSAANTVAVGDALEIETDGASTNAVKVFVTFVISR